MSSFATLPRPCLAALVALGVLAWAKPARAEVVTLIDNTRLFGTLVHYFDGEVTLETADGARVKLPTAKIKSIQWKLPKPRVEFGSPTATFNRWKQSLLKGEIGPHIECYSMMYQMMMTNLMGAMSKEELDKMLKGHRQTRYEIRGTQMKGKTLAFLKVSAHLPGADRPQAGELLFVRENGEWKLVPPQFQRPAGGS